MVVGGGHNGLVAAAYLARAGLSVLVLERLDHTGGAAVSAQAFSGHPARLSRYSYLVSLLPEQLIADLDLDLRLASRSVASYTPTLRGGRARRPAGRAPGERARPSKSFRDAHRRRRRVRRVAAVLRRRRRARPRWSRRRCSSRSRSSARSATQVDPAHLARLRDQPARRDDRGAVRRRHRARRGGDRRADRHLRLAARPVAAAEPLLPLPPDRQRHRRVAGADRRDGRGHRRARARGDGRPAPRS